MLAPRPGSSSLSGLPRASFSRTVRQFLEGYVLAPKLVGGSIGLHPVWLMLALLAFSYLFGFVELFLAIPLAAAIGALVRFALWQYLASPLYTGTHSF
jgi:predicted PurR-regulated permease PerM